MIQHKQAKSRPGSRPTSSDSEEIWYVDVVGDRTEVPRVHHVEPKFDGTLGVTAPPQSTSSPYVVASHCG